MANFAVMLVHGPGWDASRHIHEQDAWDEHPAVTDGLVDDGFIISAVRSAPASGLCRSSKPRTSRRSKRA
jgi:hypothetical protein